MAYTLTDYQDILFGRNGRVFDYQLPLETIEILTTLSGKFGATYSSNVVSHVPVKKHNHRGKHKAVDDGEWETIRSTFKPTVIEKQEDTITIIRGLLNKISVKNYETNKTNILLEMEKTPETEQSKVANFIFDIASVNKFFSEIYAQLYTELMEKFPIFHEILNSFLSGYTNKLREIHFVDSKDDYDKYCDYTKKKDSRQATTTFIVNLFKKRVIGGTEFHEIMEKVQEIIGEMAKMENKQNEVEELVEHLFIFISQSKCVFSTTITDAIQMYSKMKANVMPSLSNRAIFKYMDMFDSL